MELAEIAFTSHGNPFVARLTGELDLSNVETVRGALTERLPNHAHVLVLDLSALEYLDSSGIQLLYRLRSDLRVRGQQLRLVVPAESPSAAALRLAGIQQNIDTLASVDDALAAGDLAQQP